MFDQALITKNKNRSALHVKNSDFFRFVRADLIDRLGPIDRVYEDVLWIGQDDHRHPEHDSGSREKGATPHEILNRVLDDGRFDLICFPFGLQWIDDVQKFLRRVRAALKDGGIFICNFPGAGSLAHLRKMLFLAEEFCNQPHSPHISPFIKFDDLASLLQQAGFAENIMDYEHLFLEYDSPIALMKELKKVGESNALVSRSHYSITKSMYKFLSNCHPREGGDPENNKKLDSHDSCGNDSRPFQDQVNLITLISCQTKHSIKLKSEYFTK